MEAAARQREVDARWTAHERHHEQLEKQLEVAHAAATAALKAALADHHREHEVHAAAHDREHFAHQREHTLNDAAVANAAKAVDQRLSGMNEFRDQLRDQARTFATNAEFQQAMAGMGTRLDQIQGALDRRFLDTVKHTDERYEENRRRIEAIEKTDVKGEGKALGQGTVVAIIIGAISLVGTVLGIIIVISNFATATT